jgi:hypothetical protein
MERDPDSAALVLRLAQGFVRLEGDDTRTGEQWQQTVKRFLTHRKSAHFKDRETQLVTGFAENLRKNSNGIHQSNRHTEQSVLGL